MNDTVAAKTANSPGTPPLDPRTAPGHQVLAAAGKKVLRPGGRTATRQLFEMANFQPGETVLELASSFGYSSIDLASRYGVNVIGIEKNPESVERARANVAKVGLGDRITFIEGDIFRLDAIDQRFDAVVAEAILSMQSAPAKAKILAGVSALLKPDGRFLSHELLIEGKETEIYPALRGAIRVNTTPLSEEGWRLILADAGLTVTQHQIGAMGLLDPQTVLREEGIFDSLKMAWNLFTRPALRQRVLEMHDVFTRYRHELGYILLLARKPAGADQ
jgi:predicted O-methyltransferase YrrM